MKNIHINNDDNYATPPELYNELNKEFNFTTENNVNVIYAKNGLMKTSFAKIFKKFQEGKERDIKDIIFKRNLLQVPRETNEVPTDNLLNR